MIKIAFTDRIASVPADCAKFFGLVANALEDSIGPDPIEIHVPADDFIALYEKCKTFPGPIGGRLAEYLLCEFPSTADQSLISYFAANRKRELLAACLERYEPTMFDYEAAVSGGIEVFRDVFARYERDHDPAEFIFSTCCRGGVEFAREFVERFGMPTGKFIGLAISFDDHELLEFLLEHTVEVEPVAVDMAARHGDVEALRMMMRRWDLAEFADCAATMAIRGRQPKCLAFILDKMLSPERRVLDEIDDEPNGELCLAALDYNSLECLAILCARRIWALPEATMYRAKTPDALRCIWQLCQAPSDIDSYFAQYPAMTSTLKELRAERV